MTNDRDHDRPAGDGAPSRTAKLDRRAALARLGLAASAAYLAPSLMVLKRAKARDDDDGRGGRDGKDYGDGDRGSKSSNKSKPSSGRGGWW